jgi:hypothetical protein
MVVLCKLLSAEWFSVLCMLGRFVDLMICFAGLLAWRWRLCSCHVCSRPRRCHLRSMQNCTQHSWRGAKRTWRRCVACWCGSCMVLQIVGTGSCHLRTMQKKGSAAGEVPNALRTAVWHDGVGVVPPLVTVVVLLQDRQCHLCSVPNLYAAQACTVSSALGASIRSLALAATTPCELVQVNPD